MNLSEYDLSKIPDPEEFPQVFIPVFSSTPVLMDRCSIYSINLRAPYDKGGKYDFGPRGFARIDAYQEHFTKFIRSHDDLLFSNCLTYDWLKSKFRYRGTSFVHKGFYASIARAYSTFLQGYIGFDQSVYFRETPGLATITSYIDRLYGSDEFYKRSNPLETPPFQPFRNIFLGHYAAVREMDEALSLLKKADSQKMKLLEFLDYLVNYVHGYNAKYGDKYLFLSHKSGFPGAVIKLQGGTEFSKSWLSRRNNMNDNGKSK